MVIGHEWILQERTCLVPNEIVGFRVEAVARAEPLESMLLYLILNNECHVAKWQR